METPECGIHTRRRHSLFLCSEIDAAVPILDEDFRFELREYDEIDEDEDTGDDTDEVESSTYSHTDRSSHPDIGCSCESLGRETIAHDSASPEESDSRDDLSRDTCWIVIGRVVYLRDDDREYHEETRAHTDEDMRADTCWLLFEFSFESEYHGDDECESESEEDLLLGYDVCPHN